MVPLLLGRYVYTEIVLSPGIFALSVAHLRAQIQQEIPN